MAATGDAQVRVAGDTAPDLDQEIRVKFWDELYKRMLLRHPNLLDFENKDHSLKAFLEGIRNSFQANISYDSLLPTVDKRGRSVAYNDPDGTRLPHDRHGIEASDFLYAMFVQNSTNPAPGINSSRFYTGGKGSMFVIDRDGVEFVAGVLKKPGAAPGTLEDVRDAQGKPVTEPFTMDHVYDMLLFTMMDQRALPPNGSIVLEATDPIKLKMLERGIREINMIRQRAALLPVIFETESPQYPPVQKKSAGFAGLKDFFSSKPAIPAINVDELPGNIRSYAERILEATLPGHVFGKLPEKPAQTQQQATQNQDKVAEESPTAPPEDDTTPPTKEAVPAKDQSMTTPPDGLDTSAIQISVGGSSSQAVTYGNYDAETLEILRPALKTGDAAPQDAPQDIGDFARRERILASLGPLTDSDFTVSPEDAKFLADNIRAEAEPEDLAALEGLSDKEIIFSYFKATSAEEPSQEPEQAPESVLDDTAEGSRFADLLITATANPDSLSSLSLEDEKFLADRFRKRAETNGLGNFSDKSDSEVLALVLGKGPTPSADPVNAAEEQAPLETPEPELRPEAPAPAPAAVAEEEPETVAEAIPAAQPVAAVKDTNKAPDYLTFVTEKVKQLSAETGPLGISTYALEKLKKLMNEDPTLFEGKIVSHITKTLRGLSDDPIKADDKDIIQLLVDQGMITVHDKVNKTSTTQVVGKIAQFVPDPEGGLYNQTIAKMVNGQIADFKALVAGYKEHFGAALTNADIELLAEGHWNKLKKASLIRVEFPKDLIKHTPYDEKITAVASGITDTKKYRDTYSHAFNAAAQTPAIAKLPETPNVILAQSVIPTVDAVAEPAAAPVSTPIDHPEISIHDIGPVEETRNDHADSITDPTATEPLLNGLAGTDEFAFAGPVPVSENIVPVTESNAAPIDHPATAIHDIGSGGERRDSENNADSTTDPTATKPILNGLANGDEFAFAGPVPVPEDIVLSEPSLVTPMPTVNIQAYMEEHGVTHLQAVLALSDQAMFNAFSENVQQAPSKDAATALQEEADNVVALEEPETEPQAQTQANNLLDLDSKKFEAINLFRREDVLAESDDVDSEQTLQLQRDKDTFVNALAQAGYSQEQISEFMYSAQSLAKAGLSDPESDLALAGSSAEMDGFFADIAGDIKSSIAPQEIVSSDPTLETMFLDAFDPNSSTRAVSLAGAMQLVSAQGFEASQAILKNSESAKIVKIGEQLPTVFKFYQDVGQTKAIYDALLVAKTDDNADEIRALSADFVDNTRVLLRDYEHNTDKVGKILAQAGHPEPEVLVNGLSTSMKKQEADAAAILAEENKPVEAPKSLLARAWGGIAGAFTPKPTRVGAAALSAEVEKAAQEYKEGQDFCKDQLKLLEASKLSNKECLNGVQAMLEGDAKTKLSSKALEGASDYLKDIRDVIKRGQPADKDELVGKILWDLSPEDKVRAKEILGLLTEKSPIEVQSFLHSQKRFSDIPLFSDIAETLKANKNTSLLGYELKEIFTPEQVKAMELRRSEKMIGNAVKTLETEAQATTTFVTVQDSKKPGEPGGITRKARQCLNFGAVACVDPDAPVKSETEEQSLARIRAALEGNAPVSGVPIAAFN